jgi:pimeloyl-ACP methyl ester carboxylesterase
MAEDSRLLRYLEPGQLVDIGGRRINLDCTGSGTPTVVLMAGISSWSPVWYKTQPVIAQTTRVCAFDRASFGFSDPAPRPQVLSDTVNDLHAALTAAALPGPYVLVGHSLGGVEARLYAQRWPRDVAGMILLDTSPAGELLIEADQPGLAADESIESYVSDELYCTMLAAQGPLERSSPAYKDCSKTLPSDTPAAFREAWPRFFTASYHQALARLSSRGLYRLIEGSGHGIQLDKPQAVIDAVNDVLRQLRSAAKP